MDQYRRFDLRDVVLGRRGPVERHGGAQIGSQPDGQVIGYTAPVTEADGAHFSSAVGTRFQPRRGSYEIFEHLFAIDLAEQLAAFVVVTGIAAKRSKTIGRKRHKVVQGKPPRDVLDIWIEASILVDDDYAAQFRRRCLSCVGTDRPNQISLDASVP